MTWSCQLMVVYFEYSAKICITNFYSTNALEKSWLSRYLYFVQLYFYTNFFTLFKGARTMKSEKCEVEWPRAGLSQPLKNEIQSVLLILTYVFWITIRMSLSTNVYIKGSVGECGYFLIFMEFTVSINVLR